MKNKEPQTKGTKNSKQHKELTEKELHAAWIEKTKAKAAAMIERARKKYEQQQAERVETFGRWAPVVDALEDLVHATFDVAQEAVLESPRQLATLLRVRDAVTARLRGDEGPTPNLADVTYTVGLLAQLVDDDFTLGVAAVPDALLATLAAREVRDALSRAFAPL